MSQSVLNTKQLKAQRKFFRRSMVIIPGYAAGVGALTAALAAELLTQQPENIPSWSLVGAACAFALVSVSLLFTIRPTETDPHASAAQAAK